MMNDIIAKLKKIKEQGGWLQASATLCLIIGIVVCIALVYNYIVYILWNQIIPIFHGPHLTFFQVMGLYCLVHIFVNMIFKWRNK